MKKNVFAVTMVIFTITACNTETSPAQEQERQTLIMDGSTTVEPLARGLAEYFQENHPIEISLSGSGSGNGAKSLLNSTCDIANMSRPMKPRELSAAREKGINPVEHIVALDGIAVIVNNKNPVKEISIKQLRKIYTGELNNWKQLNGPDMSIVPISRDTNSGTYETFSSLVMNKEDIGSGIEYVGHNGAARTRVLGTLGSIAYVGLAFTNGVNTLQVDGVNPSTQNIKSKRYPLARPLYMYTNGQPSSGSAVAKFLKLARSPTGKQIISTVGFIPPS